MNKEEKLTKQSTQNPNEPRKKDIKRVEKERKENDKPIEKSDKK